MKTRNFYKKANTKLTGAARSDHAPPPKFSLENSHSFGMGVDGRRRSGSAIVFVIA
jgi:hypothetical protein